MTSELVIPWIFELVIRLRGLTNCSKVSVVLASKLNFTAPISTIVSPSLGENPVVSKSNAIKIFFGKLGTFCVLRQKPFYLHLDSNDVFEMKPC